MSSPASPRRHLADRLRHERGAELIEFAFSALVFFMLLFGITEFGRAIWHRNVISEVAREGARWAAVRGSTSDTPASASDVSTYVASRAYGIPVTVTTTWNPTDKSPGSTVTIVVSRSFSVLTRFLPFSTLALRSTAQAVVVR